MPLQRPPPASRAEPPAARPRAANATARQLGPTERSHPSRSPRRTDPRIQPGGMKRDLCTPTPAKRKCGRPARSPGRPRSNQRSASSPGCPADLRSRDSREVALRRHLGCRADPRTRAGREAGWPEPGCSATRSRAQISGTLRISRFDWRSDRTGVELPHGQPYGEDPQVARVREEVLAVPGAHARQAERGLA